MLSVYKVQIGYADDRQEKLRTIHVLATSVADATEKGMEFLKDDYCSVPEQAEDFAVTDVNRVLSIDWPQGLEEKL